MPPLSRFPLKAIALFGGVLALALIGSLAFALPQPAPRKAANSEHGGHPTLTPQATHTTTIAPAPPTTPPATPSPTTPPRVPTTTARPHLPPILAQDTFVRSRDTGWGRASDGHVWQGDANTWPGFSVDAKSGGEIEGTGVFNALLGESSLDSDVQATGMLSHFAPEEANFGIVVRWRDRGTFEKAYLDGDSLVLIKSSAGTITQLARHPFAAHGATLYTLRLMVVGVHLFVKAWQARQTEPSTWMIEASDPAPPKAGANGIRVMLAYDDDICASITYFLARRSTL